MRRPFNSLYGKNPKLPNPCDKNLEIALTILNKLAMNTKNSTWGENNQGAHEELFVDYHQDMLADILTVLDLHIGTTGVRT